MPLLNACRLSLGSARYRYSFVIHRRSSVTTATRCVQRTCTCNAICTLDLLISVPNAHVFRPTVYSPLPLTRAIATTTMHCTQTEQHVCCEECPTSHPNDPIPVEPSSIREIQSCPKIITAMTKQLSSSSSSTSLESTSLEYSSSSEPPSPLTPSTDPHIDETNDAVQSAVETAVQPVSSRRRRVSTALISSSSQNVQRILIDNDDFRIKLIEKICCEDDCCFLNALSNDFTTKSTLSILTFNNDVFRSLQLKLDSLNLNNEFIKLIDVFVQIVSFSKLSNDIVFEQFDVYRHFSRFVTSHPLYEIYSIKIHHAKKLIKSNAKKKHFILI